MNRERLARAKQALDESGLDALFVFRTEDSRYITGYRHHLGPPTFRATHGVAAEGR
jgi:Xaa-Pro aminopeptidase